MPLTGPESAWFQSAVAWPKSRTRAKASRQQWRPLARARLVRKMRRWQSRKCGTVCFAGQVLVPFVLGEVSHRMQTSKRAVARLLGMSPNTERQYREALERVGLLEGAPGEIPELAALQAAVRQVPAVPWLPPGVASPLASAAGNML